MSLDPRLSLSYGWLFDYRAAALDTDWADYCEINVLRGRFLKGFSDVLQPGRCLQYRCRRSLINEGNVLEYSQFHRESLTDFTSKRSGRYPMDCLPLWILFSSRFFYPESFCSASDNLAGEPAKVIYGINFQALWTRCSIVSLL